MIDDSWHYPRTEVVERVYTALTSGPNKALTLFGPRQTGKTEFLVKDLAPYAEERGHAVVYVDFWQRRNTSLSALLRALDQSLRGGTFTERLKMAIKGVAPNIRIGSSDKSVKCVVSLDKLKKEMPIWLSIVVDAYFDQLANKKRSAFLILDEFQDISRAPYAEDFIASLSISLNKRRDSLITVFSGSSQDELRKMFNDRTAPSLAYATGYSLPQLDEDFVDHQLDNLKRNSRVDVERSVALDVFHRFNGNPLVLQRWLTHLLLNPNMDQEESIAETLETIAEQYAYRKT